MRPRCPGSSTSRLSPKVSMPSSLRRRTNRSPASRSSFAKETPCRMAGNRTLPTMVDEADELYGLPDAEFTAARDALAKRLRAEKRREDADAVKALRRPSVAAAAINRAVREHGADEVLAAGEALRAAHEALVRGGGDAAAVREAMARERDAVRSFARRAVGEGASEATEQKVRATLHAASVDDDVREALTAGRLEREAEAGTDPMALLAASAGRPGGKRARSASGTSTGSASGKSARSTKPARSGAASGGRARARQ